MADTPAIRFRDVHIDVPAREVRVAGRPVHLEPQAFDVLVMLVRERSRVVSKEELLDGVWGDQFVSESALTTRIKEVRRAVGDDGTRQEVVKNIRGRGYRFVAEVDVEVAGEVDGEVDQVAGESRRRDPFGIASRLIGRDDEFTVAVEALHAGSVVSLVGPGGVGKTSLALAIAGRLDGERSDGTVFVTLGGITRTTSLLPAIRDAAGLHGVDTAEMASAIARLDALVVLDNCEHLVGPVTSLVSDISNVDGRASVLITSRERLGVSGEQVVPIEPLSPELARELFVARAQAARPGFEIDVDDQPVVRAMLADLDHLPLAIEMAAGRVGAIALADLAELIAERVDVLRSPDRSAVDRHHTLGALVDWSYDLLDDRAQRILTDFSVFDGTATPDDAVAVLDVADRAVALAALADLTDRSLLMADTSGPRTAYRMLSTIRTQVGRRRSASIDRRHAEWYTTVAEQADRDLRTVREPDGAARFERSIDEFRNAHRWAVANDPRLAARLTGALDLFAHTRHATEPATWAADVLEVLPEGSDGLAGVRAALAAECAHRGDLPRARELAEWAAASHDDRARISALETLSDVTSYDGDLESGARFGRELYELGVETSDLHAIASGLAGWSLSIAYGGATDEALAILDHAGSRAYGPTDRAWIEYSLAETLANTRPGDALGHYAAAIDHGESVGSRFVAGVATTGLLALRARVDDPFAALDAFAPILREYRRSGDATHSITAMRNLVDLLTRTEEDETAMRLLGALSDESVKPTYGDERARLDASRSLAMQRHGSPTVENWIASTAGRDHRWALDHAIDYLAVRQSRQRQNG